MANLPEQLAAAQHTFSNPTPASVSSPFITPLCRNHHLHTPEAAQTHPCCFAGAGFATELKMIVFEFLVQLYTDHHRFIQLQFKPRNRKILMPNTPNPMPLFLCYLSRVEAMKYYVRLDNPESGSYKKRLMEPFYMYPDHDTVVFCPVQDFGTERTGRWGFFRGDFELEIYGSGCKELEHFIQVGHRWHGLRLIKSLALRPGANDEYTRKGGCFCSWADCPGPGFFIAGGFCG